MAQLRGHVNVRVDQAGEDESHIDNVTTCFALPGQGTIKASASSCHFNVHAAVYDDLSVYIGINGQISDPVTAAAGYSVRMCANPNDWDWVYTGGQLVGPTGAANWTATIDATDGSASRAPSWASGQTANQASSWQGGSATGKGWFIWNFSCGDPASDNSGGAGSGYMRAGLLTDFHGNDQNQDGYLYLGGTGTYSVNDPIYPDPIRITIPGFMAFLDYYPFAVRKSGQWMSCNREGGSTTIRKSGSWRDVKNVAVGEGNDNAFILSGGAWSVAPEIGAK